MSKVLIGCAIASVLVVVLLVVTFGSILWFADRDLADADAGLRRQAEVTRELNALEEEVRFTPPRDGVVGDDRARRFFEVTEDVWEDVRGWAEELRQPAGETASPEVAELRTALRAHGRARVVTAETLAEYEMPPSEYLWTGYALLHALAHLGQTPEESGVPAANLELARQNENVLREIARGEEEREMTRGTIFGVAESLAIGEAAGRRLTGWDTLRRSAR